MPYRVCKAFEVESGHMLSKHPDRCRYPHGHSRRIEIVLAADTLDAHDMVCDFKAIKLAVAGHLDRLDHAMALNAADPALDAIRAVSERVVTFDADPTTEILARDVYEFLEARLAAREPMTDHAGNTYRFPPGVRVERVRVGETSTSWAEFSRA
ncbi:MAG: 6-carboxytetrahydropterin synthase [Phycisphaerales bacterium]|nr:MAG: 6-carboxytetrahydropterin synthase [Phycisphaerales bacterium]